MRYDKTVRASFLSRPNRFIAQVELEGEVHTVHVKNTGRCRELLLPGAEVYLTPSSNPSRKTKYDLVSVKKGDLLINMDSMIPNGVCEEWISQGKLFPEGAMIKREVRYGESRFDLYAEWGDRRGFIEVKGVTLESDGVAMFPDAPTERGIKHIKELMGAVSRGYEAYIVFVIQMKGVKKFCPNDLTHKAFGDALRQAAEAGVHIIAIDCVVTEDSVTADEPVPICL